MPILLFSNPLSFLGAKYDISLSQRTCDMLLCTLDIHEARDLFHLSMNSVQVHETRHICLLILCTHKILSILSYEAYLEHEVFQHPGAGQPFVAFINLPLESIAVTGHKLCTNVASFD